MRMTQERIDKMKFSMNTWIFIFGALTIGILILFIWETL